MMKSRLLRLYVGTYTLPMSFVQGQGVGIYTCGFDTDSGTLEKIAATPAPNPSYLALHPDGRHLYAVNELSEENEPTQDAISAYTLDGDAGVPEFINRQPAFGSSPCHVAVEPSGRYAYIATYTGGNLTAYRIGADGELGVASDHIKHARSGKVAHAHSINPALNGNYAIACDLGLDLVLVYRLDLFNGKMLPHSEIQLVHGSGPRHLTYHPNGRSVYVINELNGTINTLGWKAGTGELEMIQTINTLPQDYRGPAWCADIHVHPNGRYLYGSNRGNHSIVIYRVDEARGELCLVGFVPTHGEVPRSFVIDPQGQWLLVGNQNSNTISIFRVQLESGQLEYHSSLEIPTPVCLKFAV